MHRSFLLSLLLFLSLLFARAQEAAPVPVEQYISTLLSGIERDNLPVGELTLESLQNLPVGIEKTLHR